MGSVRRRGAREPRTGSGPVNLGTSKVVEGLNDGGAELGVGIERGVEVKRVTRFRRPCDEPCLRVLAEVREQDRVRVRVVEPVWCRGLLHHSSGGEEALAGPRGKSNNKGESVHDHS